VGLNVYYPNDVRNALLAAEQAVNAATDAAGDQDDPFTAGFLAGYRAALTTIALAFGLPTPRQAGLVKPSPDHSQSPALEAALFVGRSR